MAGNRNRVMNSDSTQQSAPPRKRYRRGLRLVLLIAAVALGLAAGLPLWLPVVSGTLTPIRIDADGPLWKRPLGLTLRLGSPYGRVRAAVSEVYPAIRLESVLWIPDENEIAAVEAGDLMLSGIQPWQDPPARQISIGSLKVYVDRLRLWRSGPEKEPSAAPPVFNQWFRMLETLFRKMPEMCRVQKLQVQLASPEGFVTLEGSPVNLQSEPMPASWSYRFGVSALRCAIQNSETTFPLPVRVTGHLHGSSTEGVGLIHMTRDDSQEGSPSGCLSVAWDAQGISRARLDLEGGTLEGPAWAMLFRILTGGGLTFDRLDLEPLSLEATRQATGGWQTSASGRARITGLAWGSETLPWYHGNGTADWKLDTDGTITARLELENAGYVELQAVPVETAYRVTLALSDWLPRSWPKPIPWLEPWLSPWIPWLPEKLDARLDGIASWSGGLPQVKRFQGTCSAAWPEPGDSVHWTVDAETSTDGFQVSLRDTDDKETLNVAVEGPPTGWRVLTVRAAGVDIARWLRRTRGWNALDGLDGTWSGAITLNSAQSEVRWQVTGDSNLSWHGHPLGTPGQVRASGRIYRDAKHWLISGTAQLSDRTRITVGMAEWLGGTRLRGEWQVPGVDAAELASLAGLTGIWGELAMPAAGRFDAEYGRLTWETGDVTSTSLGWGPFFLPTDWTLRARATGIVRWEHADGWSVRMEQVRAEADRTVLTLDRLTAEPGGIELNNLDINTDLAPLTRWGWLSDAQGADAHIQVASGQLPADTLSEPWTGSVEYRVAADRLSLWNGRITLETTNWTGCLARGTDGRLSGESTLSIAAIKTMGGTITEVTGRTVASGDRLDTENLSALAWNGSVNGQVTVFPLDSAMPVRGSLRLRDISLGRFCDEVKPPYVRCEGTLNGWSRFALEHGRPSDFRFRATAGSGFSVNTDFVRQLLTRKQVSDYAGGTQAAAVLLNVLGTEPQRPFDLGALDMRLVEERLTGVLTLQSRNLNLTLDIKADPLALLDALEASSVDQAEPGR